MVVLKTTRRLSHLQVCHRELLEVRRVPQQLRVPLDEVEVPRVELPAMLLGVFLDLRL